jgi:hypothetical protein
MLSGADKDLMVDAVNLLEASLEATTMKGAIVAVVVCFPAELPETVGAVLASGDGLNLAAEVCYQGYLKRCERDGVEPEKVDEADDDQSTEPLN